MTPSKFPVPPTPSSAHTHLLTVSEAARELRVDDSTVRRWIKNRLLPAVSLPHMGRRYAYRIKRETLDALLADDSSPPVDALALHHVHLI